MKKDRYQLIENYMLSCMESDTAHDKEHIYRVLYTALDIAQAQDAVDCDVLICACLLHDIGRREQVADPGLCHAQVGAKKAFEFLKQNGFPEAFCTHVRDCIRTHRFRSGDTPQSIEAKILFDADKLDVSGVVGIARTLAYKGQHGEPLYSRTQDNHISDGSGDKTPSFFQEYKYKLEHIYDKFYTERGKTLARARQKAAADFYNSLFAEISDSCDKGLERLEEYIK